MYRNKEQTIAQTYLQIIVLQDMGGRKNHYHLSIQDMVTIQIRDEKEEGVQICDSFCKVKQITKKDRIFVPFIFGRDL